jgi:hypothetical protein
VKIQVLNKLKTQIGGTKSDKKSLVKLNPVINHHTMKIGQYINIKPELK